MKRDLIDVIESAYRVHEVDDAWLRGVLEAARPHIDAGLGIYGFFLDASNYAAVRISGLQVLGGPAGTAEAAFQVTAALQLSPQEQRASGLLDAQEMAARLMSRPQIVTTATRAGGERWWSSNAAVRKWFHPLGIRDSFGVRVVDPSRRGIFLGAALPSASSTSRVQRLVWGRIAAHIAAGDRLRRRILRARTTREDVLGSAEAILAVDGRVEHATDAAKAPSCRAALRAMAVAMDKARGALRRRDPMEALALWRALIDGRWTLLDHFDRDGRRYLLARRNDTDPALPAALTLRERQVAGWAALGHSLKLISYEVGLSAASISSHLEAAMLKLGVSTRAELVSVCAPMVRILRQVETTSGPLA